MTKVYKFSLEISDEQKVLMPEGAKVLTVQVHLCFFFFWAECNPDEEPVLRTFLICGTGHSIDDDIEKEYIGTIQMCEGSIVFHVFEKKNP